MGYPTQPVSFPSAPVDLGEIVLRSTEPIPTTPVCPNVSTTIHPPVELDTLELFKIVEVPADGNCLMSSMAYAYNELNSPEKKLHPHKLRHDITQWVVDHWELITRYTLEYTTGIPLGELVAGLLKQHNVSGSDELIDGGARQVYAEYFPNKRSDGNYYHAGSAEMIAMVHLYNVNIRVLPENLSKAAINFHPTACNTPWISILQSPNHYRALVLR